jgi:serine protease
MKLRALCALAALMASCVVCSLPAAAAEMQPKRAPRFTEPQDEARVIVQFKNGAGTVKAHALPAGADRAAAAAALQRRADALAGRRGVALTTGRGITERRQVVRAVGVDSATLAKVLAADPDVEFAEVDHRRRATTVPNDPRFAPTLGTSPASGQWYLKAPDLTTPASINAVGAWDITQGSSNVIVAVLDTGVRFDHPDLAGKLLPGFDFVHDATLANDTNGYDSNAEDPGDWVSATDKQNTLFKDCDVANSSWHGTIVSGIVGAATDNGVGMAGVGWNTKILPVRVLGKCFGYDSDIQAGMLWAAGIDVPGAPHNSTPAQVLNLSLGGDGTCSNAYATAISRVVAQGVTIVVAAGNGNGHAVETPGSCAGVIAVAGLRHVGTKVGYSDLGPEVSIAAPAGNCVNTDGSACLYPILSTTNKGTKGPVTGALGAAYTDAVNYSVGTSFSAPQVAGTVALMLAANPTLTPAQVKNLLQSSARQFPSSSGIPMCQPPSSSNQDECNCTTSTCGAGMLDAGAAVQAAAQLAGLQAVVTVTPSAPMVGDTVTLSGTQSHAVPGRSVASYSWTLLAGGDVASFSSATDASSVTLTTTKDGTFTVRLTVTDDAGSSAFVDKQVTVATASSSNGTTLPPETPAPSSGGGGGALSWPWLLALALAVALLAPRRRRRAQI